MTPEEAKTRWCPMARVAQGINRWGDKYQPMPDLCMCVADECMLWQWSVTPKGASSAMGRTPDGHCGLARP